jgi:hypothetical protein
MKRLFLLIAISLMATSLSFSQTVHDDCKPGSIFSQPLDAPISAYTSDEAGATQYENFYALTSDIGGMTFWGYMWDGNNNCYTPGPQDFKINFYQDNNGAIGALAASFNVTITPTLTGLTFLNGALILRYEVTLPTPVSLSDGWFSVIKSNPTGNSCMFYYLCTYPGDYHSAYSYHASSVIHYSNNNRAICLTEVTSNPVPVSDWALGIGILLILGFIIVRYSLKIA